nr:hypothetical protein [Tanacetum cinerariifolium]
MYYPRFKKVIIDYFMTRKPSISRKNRINWHYVRDDVLFSTIKVVSRHQTTQQYGAILPIELTTDDIRNSKAYKEYYACAMGEAAPKSKASARKKKGKQPARATTPTEPTDIERTKAEQLKIVLKRSRQETHISQQHGSGTDEGTGSRPGVPDVPSDDSEEELSWNSSDDKEDDDQEGPSTGSDRGSKRLREGGKHASASTLSETATKSAGRSTTGSQSRQLSTSESAFAEEPVQTTCQMEEPSHPVFETGADDQPIHPEWFSLPKRPPSPDRDWNKTLPSVQGDAQSWISVLARQTDARSSFNELLDTPIDFSNFIMNRLNVDTLTPALLAGPTYELMRGSCTSLTELEYHLEEVYKA